MTTVIAARAYTLAEVDAMREAIEARYKATNYSHGPSRATTVVSIEEQLRTYMMAGVSVEEVEAVAKEAVDKRAAFAKAYADKRKLAFVEAEARFNKIHPMLSLDERLDQFDRDLNAAMKSRKV